MKAPLSVSKSLARFNLMALAGVLALQAPAHAEDRVDALVAEAGSLNAALVVVAESPDLNRSEKASLFEEMILNRGADALAILGKGRDSALVTVQKGRDAEAAAMLRTLALARLEVLRDRQRLDANIGDVASDLFYSLEIMADRILQEAETARSAKLRDVSARLSRQVGLYTLKQNQDRDFNSPQDEAREERAEHRQMFKNLESQIIDLSNEKKRLEALNLGSNTLESIRNEHDRQTNEAEINLSRLLPTLAERDDQANALAKANHRIQEIHKMLNSERAIQQVKDLFQKVAALNLDESQAAGLTLIKQEFDRLIENRQAETSYESARFNVIREIVKGNSLGHVLAIRANNDALWDIMKSKQDELKRGLIQVESYKARAVGTGVELEAVH